MAPVRWFVVTALVAAGCAASAGRSDRRGPTAATPPPATRPARPSIVGIVTDGASTRPIPFCNVHVIGTRLGAQTDQAGRFMLVVPDTGFHQVRAMHVGYEPALRSVRVVTDRTDTLSVRMTRMRLPEGVVIDTSSRY